MVQIWAIDTWEKVVEFRTNPSEFWPSNLAWSPSAHILATIEERDRSVCLWDLIPTKVAPPYKPVAAKNTEAPTRVVDALHSGDHSTLADALEAAKPGDRILVRPGRYKEGVVIDKAVEIIGDGKLHEIVVEATGKNAVLFKASMGRIANLTLRQIGSGDWYCIDIAQGRLDLEDCDITSQSLACVAIHGGADPHVRRNSIHDGEQGGVYVYDNGQGTLQDNDIHHNALAGVAINTGGNPTLRANRIHSGTREGVYVEYNGQGTLELNEIFDNGLAGVAINTGGNPTLRNNRIHGNQEGVYVGDNGEGTLENNAIYGNTFAGVAIKTGSNLTVRRNSIYDGKREGVFVDGGRGMLEENDISGNASAGVEIKSGGHLTVRLNRISKNSYTAIYVHDGGGGVFEENDLRGNAKGAWDVSPDCLDKVSRTLNREEGIGSDQASS